MQRKIFSVQIIFFGLVFFSSAGLAISFDCMKAASQVEKMICTEPTLFRLDEELAAQFRRIVADRPEVQPQQTEWLRTSRDKCETVDCLTAAYTDQIKILSNKPAQSISIIAQTEVPVNPVAIFMDMRHFIGPSSLFKEYTWSDPREKVFGKSTAEWTEQDFILLEQRLSEQVNIERDASAQRMRQIGLNRSPDEDSIFRIRKEYLDEAIAAIPKFKYWVGIAQERVKMEAARQFQIKYEEQQRLEKEIERQDKARDAQERSDKMRQAEKIQQDIKFQVEFSIAQKRANQQRQAEEIQRQQQSAQREAEYKRQQEKESNDKNTLIFIGVLTAAIGGWFWNKFIRLRCSRCKSVSIDTINVTEIDRWRGTKEVSEKNTRGTKTRHIQTTFVKNLYEYRCKICQHKWSKEIREEL